MHSPIDARCITTPKILSQSLVIPVCLEWWSEENKSTKNCGSERNRRKTEIQTRHTTLGKHMYASPRKGKGKFSLQPYLQPPAGSRRVSSYRNHHPRATPNKTVGKCSQLLFMVRLTSSSTGNRPAAVYIAEAVGLALLPFALSVFRNFREVLINHPAALTRHAQRPTVEAAVRCLEHGLGGRKNHSTKPLKATASRRDRSYEMGLMPASFSLIS